MLFYFCYFVITKYHYCFIKKHFMFKKLCFIWFLFMPLQAYAWDDAIVLAFIENTNSVLQSQKRVSDTKEHEREPATRFCS